MWIVCIDKNLSNAHVIIGVDLDDHILPHEPLTAGELHHLPRLARTLELPQESPAVKLGGCSGRQRRWDEHLNILEADPASRVHNIHNNHLPHQLEGILTQLYGDPRERLLDTAQWILT